MIGAILGRKLGMTRIFSDDGAAVPVTVIEAGPCHVVQAGADQVQLAFGAKKDKNAPRAERGHAKKAGLDAAPAVLRTVPYGGEPLELGTTVTVDQFQPGDVVKVTGTTKGRGFQGVVHRYGFRGGPASHGSTRYRRPGSLGPGTDPSRVLKGKKMPGQMGNERHTELGLSVVRVDVERNLLFLRGAVPGPRTGVVMVRKQERKSRYV